MKTPDEIKKGLACCVTDGCDRCPYEECNRVFVDAMVECTLDALKYIQRLEKHIGDITNMVPRWVSVKEREPEHNGLYYCHTDMWGDIMCRYIDKSWLDNKATFANFPRRPTHWLEIPKIPKPPKEDT